METDIYSMDSLLMPDIIEIVVNIENCLRIQET